MEKLLPPLDSQGGIILEAVFAFKSVVLSKNIVKILKRWLQFCTQIHMELKDI